MLFCGLFTLVAMVGRYIPGLVLSYVACELQKSFRVYLSSPVP